MVTTTINVPSALEAYVKQFDRCGHRNVDVIVIGDLRTPANVYGWARSVGGRGCRILYFGPEEQRDWLKRFPDLEVLVPWNSIQRRNIGYLMAVERGAEVIVSIDDDNYVSEEDFLKAHSVVGETRTMRQVASSTGWFNVCAALEMEPDIAMPPRGFPTSQRHVQPTVSVSDKATRVAVNAGLWLDDPDVDAVTRLVTSVKALRVRPGYALPVGLDVGTYCPFNSQNTSFAADLLPCMYLVVMGGRFLGMKVGRYDDIWMSYFAKRIIDHMGDAVMFGAPIVWQQRNEHSILKDLAEELPGMMITEILIRALDEVDLSENTYLSCYRELVEKLRMVTSRSGFCSTEENTYLASVFDGMHVWAEASERILVGD